jgi:polyhydroxybutyrate depolymerase
MFSRLTLAFTIIALFLANGCATTSVPDQLADGVSYSVAMSGEVDGYRRSYRVHIPEGYRETEPMPLVVVLHGAFSTSAEMEEHTGFSELADREGFVVAYPDGIGILGFLQHWNAGHCCGKAAADQIDDVGFVADVIADVKNYANINPDRVYMVGFSNGAMLTHRFAVERPELLAAAAPLAGAIGSESDPGVMGWQMPAPRARVPMIMFHGKQDNRIPYGDTTPTSGTGGRSYSTVLASSRFWWSHNGCESHRSERSPSFPGVIVDTWSDCEENADVQLFTLRDWGHRWPGPFFTEQAGARNTLYGFDASEIIWKFFQRYGHDGASARPA